MLNNRETSLLDQPRSGHPLIGNNEAQRDLVEQQPQTSTCRVSAELGSSDATIDHHLHQTKLVNRRCRGVPHTLIRAQQQRHVNTCILMLRIPQMFVSGIELLLKLRSGYFTVTPVRGTCGSRIASLTGSSCVSGGILRE